MLMPYMNVNVNAIYLHMLSLVFLPLKLHVYGLILQGITCIQGILEYAANAQGSWVFNERCTP